MNMKQMMPIIVLMLIVVAFSVFYVVKGLNMQARVSGEEAKFHQLQTAYFTQSKAVRDSAETGSPLNRDLATIQNYPSELLRLKLVGIGNILAGIFIMLGVIGFLLFMMPVRLRAMLPAGR